MHGRTDLQCRIRIDTADPAYYTVARYVSGLDVVGPRRCQLVSSPYAIGEAERNLEAGDRRARLYRLIQQIEIADEPPPTVSVQKGIDLTAKDQPIILAAIHAKCSHLLTGDHRHFGALFGQLVKGVRILTVRDYLAARGITEEIG